MRRQGDALNCAVLVQAPSMTQEQVADATGLTSVHVNRTLQSMRRDGLIRADRHDLTILDWAALQAAGDFSRAYLHQRAHAA